MNPFFVNESINHQSIKTKSDDFKFVTNNSLTANNSTSGFVTFENPFQNLEIEKQSKKYSNLNQSFTNILSESDKNFSILSKKDNIYANKKLLCAIQFNKNLTNKNTQKKINYSWQQQYKKFAKTTSKKQISIVNQEISKSECIQKRNLFQIIYKYFKFECLFFNNKIKLIINLFILLIFLILINNMFKIFILMIMINSTIIKKEQEIPSGLKIQKLIDYLDQNYNIQCQEMFEQLDLSLPTLRISSNFIAQFLTIIFQEQDINLQTDNFKPFLDQFEIDLNTDSMQSLFKKKFEQKQNVNFQFNFNTSLHTKLNTKKCKRDQFQTEPNTNEDDQKLSCLTVPFEIELFEQKYLSLLKVEFYLLKTISYSRFVITNLYFDFYEDQTEDFLIKADKVKDFINQTLFYAVGSINFAFSQNYQNIIDKFESYCHHLNILQDDEEYYVACY